LETRFSYNSGVDNFVVHPVYIDRYIPTPATGELGQAILDYESELSRPMGTWIVRAAGAATATILLDTNVTRTPHFFTDTLQMAAMDTFTTSAPFKLRGDGYPVSVTSSTPGVQLRIGREMTMIGNMEEEGSTLWYLNSTYERYDTVAYRGARSIRLNRAGGGQNSVSTNFLYRCPFNESWNVSMIGWIRLQNARDATMQLGLYDARSGGQEVGLWTPSGTLQGTLPWTEFWQDIETPQSAWYYDIILHLRAPASGTGFAWFDDVMLEELK
jgi:hypothetical protein